MLVTWKNNLMMMVGGALIGGEIGEMISDYGDVRPSLILAGILICIVHIQWRETND